ncbi:hypothetical protein [Pedosphaera parvula]|uniref:Uncharacterized protein n=1 Tax=Pedosphaera parvula (strain Ellin514) TaxID=320771 RepID=B9XCI8_PEDPL|nr:hypothetical protein [Pedosphaera parvula]EEF62656.1 hypothetical protein Cflav_PD5291 [Pedosphaera parvula Ellin514]
MKLAIAALIVIAVLFGGYQVWEYWDKVSHDRDVAEKDAAAHKIVPEQLAGMPTGLQPTYQAAQKGGAAGIRSWLRIYGAKVQDPRKAWIELDYAVAISREDPVEAKKVYAEVKNRIPENSEVSGRVKELEKAFQ